MVNRFKHIIDGKNFLLIVTVFAVSILIGVILPYLQYKSRQNTQDANLREQIKKNPAGQTLNNNIFEIDYTNKGFEPKNMRIQSGDTVMWTNISDKLMWVASNSHPSHTDLPGFDQLGTGNSGADRKASFIAHAHEPSVYRYTFTKKGQWGYHNHIFPADRGIIIVE